MNNFKKIFIVGILMLSTTLFAGCQIHTQDFKAAYYWGSHKFGYSAFLINSKQDFEDLMAEAGSSYGDFATYDDGFFDDSSLIAMFLPIGSGSIKLRVKSVEYSAGSVNVQIDKYSPMMQTCDMSYWLILVRPDKKLPPETNIGFGFNEVSRTLADLRKI